MERVDGIEPSSLDWKSKVIPLYDIRLVMMRGNRERELREKGVTPHHCFIVTLSYWKVKRFTEVYVQLL